MKPAPHRVLFDVNVVLDVLLKRPAHFSASAQVASLADQKALRGLLCATTFTTVEYLVAKAVGQAATQSQITRLLQTFDVAPVDGAVLQDALAAGFGDYEDAVQHAAAQASGCKAIISRDLSGFRASRLPVYLPEQFLSWWALGQDA
ncbi:MAG: PIN domain-containing protein [Burkholderiaceae bacterium]|nr:PIN domain-containing protein [Burkholderiaceae bacterium]